MARTLQLQFRNEQDRTVTVSVADAREDLEPTEVEEVMNNLLERNIIYSTGGDLTQKTRAQIVSRTVETLLEF
jgi:hypothetical protein